jgi:hypothetical protein
MTARSLALTMFCIALAGSAWLIGGAGAWTYLIIYLLALAPGVPIGFALFGRHHAGGWIAAAVIGYALTAFALWAPIAAGIPSFIPFVASWIVVAALSWLVCRRIISPCVALPPWTPAGSAGLLAVLVLTLAIATPPFAHVAKTDAEGNRYYRAYFTADFVWHTALTSEIGKFSMPPRNPYLARQPIHYYWTYYLLPAVVSETGPPPVRDVQLCLKINALMTGLLLMSSVFLAAWTVAGRAVASAIASSLGLLASSAEGIYQTFKLWQRGVPLSELRNWNIDAVTAWPPLGGHRIDGLQRCLWYVPQHSMAYALGIIALAAAGAAGPSASLVTIALCGVALGCSVAFNPLVGGIFALTYGLSIVVAGWTQPRSVLRHAVAAVPVVVAVLWCASNQMVEGAGGFLQFGLLGASRQQPIFTLFLSLGPILVTGAAGLVAARGLPFAPALPYAILAVLSLFLMYFVRLSVDQAWMAFRAGQMMIVALAALTARFIAASTASSRRLAAAVVVGLALIFGTPTTIIDEYNAQDIHNLAMGPGFPWTITVTPQQQRAYAWIRENTPATAVVQMDARSRERSTWSNIPSFAERRMSGGLPISLLNIPEYAERSDRIRTMYSTSNRGEAENIAHSLRIDYVYVDEVERRAYAKGIRFDGSPAFEKVFEDGPVAVYRVR